MFSAMPSSGITTHYPSGTEIIRKFMPNTGVHVVCDGVLAISEKGATPKSVILNLVPEGGILGIVEYSLDLRRYHFSAHALNDSVVTFFPLTEVRQFCADHAGEMKLLAAISRSFRQLERRYVLLGIAEAADRLIATLLWLSEMGTTMSDYEATIPFELTSATLSSLIGARPETVTRLMSQLRTDGLLHYSEGRIGIPNRAQLKARFSLDPNLIFINPLMA